jgi:hypothetical protein
MYKAKGRRCPEENGLFIARWLMRGSVGAWRYKSE